ncbi:Phosphotransferase OS=Streptomyces fumanus OX=67302 GN=GCM10018772_18160 PE=3 SV=1 [Streptomyces fumanus]
MALERQWLPRLAPHLPVAVPEVPRGAAGGSLAVVGVRWLPGENPRARW